MLISRVSDFHDGCPKLVVLVGAGLKCRRGESDCVCMCEREANELHPCWKLISPFIHRACLSEWLWRRIPRLRCISSNPTTTKRASMHINRLVFQTGEEGNFWSLVKWVSVSAAVDHSISQAPLYSQHYITQEEESLWQHKQILCRHMHSIPLSEAEMVKETNIVRSGGQILRNICLHVIYAKPISKKVVI